MLGSRWALQVASGHLWHLAYAWTPFALYFLDRAIDEDRRDLAGAAGAMLALIIYVGGIYPYPHTLMVLWLYALGRAIAARSRRPLALFLFSMFTGIGLGAPKLLPALATMSRFPRLIESNEPVSLHSIWIMLTAHQQGFDFYPHLPLRVFWVWWEWGAYVGVAGALALVAALAVGWSPRLVSLKVAAVCCVILSLGPVDLAAGPPAAAVQLAAPAGAAALPGHPAAGAGPGRRRRRALGARPRRRRLGRGGRAGRSSRSSASTWRRSPGRRRSRRSAWPSRPSRPSAEFRQERAQHYVYGKPDVGPALRDRYEWPAKIIYPSMLANTGMVTCYGIPLEASHSEVIGSERAAATAGWSFSPVAPAAPR